MLLKMLTELDFKLTLCKIVAVELDNYSVIDNSFEENNKIQHISNILNEELEMLSKCLLIFNPSRFLFEGHVSRICCKRKF